MRLLKALILMTTLTGSLAFAATPCISSASVVKQEDRKIEIEQANLDPLIQEDLLKNYPKAVFLKAFKYVNEDGDVTKYEVRLQNNGTDVALIYDSEGRPEKIDQK